MISARVSLIGMNTIRNMVGSLSGRIGLLTLLLWSWSFWSPFSLSAQIHKHQVEFGIGILNTLSKDVLAAPSRYSGSGAPLSIGYVFQAPNFLHQAGVRYSQTGFAAGSLDRNGEAAFGKANYILLELQYAYARRISTDKSGRLALWLGPMWNTFGHVREYFYTPTNSEITWEVLSSLGVYFKAGYLIGEGNAAAEILAPLIAYVNRPPYAVEGDDVFHALFERSEFLKLGRFVIPGRLTSFSALFSYTHRLTTALGVKAGYHLSMYRYRKPLTTAAILSELRLSFFVSL